jgi:hypothetical protein
MEKISIMPYLEHGHADLVTGTVRMAMEDSIVVELHGHLATVRLAASCLVRPEIGDTVLVFRIGDREGFILAVLVHVSDKPVTLGFEHGVTLETGVGAFVVEAPDVLLEAEHSISVVGTELAVRTVRSDVAVKTLTIRGKKLTATWEQARTKIRYLDEVYERVVQKVNHCYRTVTEFEESRLGRLRMLVGGRFSLRSKQASVSAEETVKIDGETIHLG